MKLLLITFALLGATGGHASESSGGGLRASSSAAAPLVWEDGPQCPPNKCRGKKCTTDNTLEIKCIARDGTATSSIEPTDISSKKEFQDADVCDGACGKGQRCSAKWHGSWHCGGTEKKSDRDSDREVCAVRGGRTAQGPVPHAMCTMNYDPVCGCDGKTYGNDCVAKAAGWMVRREGECKKKKETRETRETKSGEGGGQCPRSKCRGRECKTDNTLEIKCTARDGTATSSIRSTSISSKKEFQDADVCDGACGKGQRCNAKWHGSWRCGADEGEGEFVTFGEEDYPEEKEEQEEMLSEGKQCPRSKCRGRECKTNNTLEIKCTARDGTETSSIRPTDISSKREFQKADVCDGACGKGQRCSAKWRGSWRCGADEGEGEFVTFAEGDYPVSAVV